MENPCPFFTIGHSTREIGEFIELLKSRSIALLADVRSVPRSIKNPQFNENVLPAALHAVGIKYLRIPALGGFRAKSKTVPPETNAFWQHNSFHSYADYAMSGAFKEGMNELLESGAQQRTAIMCAEMLWWRCHRRIITDYLIANGRSVYHIIGLDDVKPARLSANARITSSGALSYPL